MVPVPQQQLTQSQTDQMTLQEVMETDQSPLSHDQQQEMRRILEANPSIMEAILGQRPVDNTQQQRDMQQFLSQLTMVRAGDVRIVGVVDDNGFVEVEGVEGFDGGVQVYVVQGPQPATPHQPAPDDQTPPMTPQDRLAQFVELL